MEVHTARALKNELEELLAKQINDFLDRTGLQLTIVDISYDMRVSASQFRPEGMKYIKSINIRVAI
jgi:hypothetical protein